MRGKSLQYNEFNEPVSRDGMESIWDTGGKETRRKIAFCSASKPLIKRPYQPRPARDTDSERMEKRKALLKFFFKRLTADRQKA